MIINSFLSKAQKLPTLYNLLPLAYVSLPTTLHKIAFFCSEWRESGQCGASAMALTTSPITLALENCSIRKPIQLVVGRENQGKNTLNVNYIYEPRKGKPKVGKSGMGSQKGMYY